MSREYGYLEAIGEVFKDKNKKFKEKAGEVMFFNEGTNSLNIRMYRDVEELIINDNWIKSKWTLVEEKKNYNVRIYNTVDSKLISSEVVEMTESEIDNYCENKIVNGTKCSPIIIGTLYKYRSGNGYTFSTIVEEIITI